MSHVSTMLPKKLSGQTPSSKSRTRVLQDIETKSFFEFDDEVPSPSPPVVCQTVDPACSDTCPTGGDTKTDDSRSVATKSFTKSVQFHVQKSDGGPFVASKTLSSTGGFAAQSSPLEDELVGMYLKSHQERGTSISDFKHYYTYAQGSPFFPTGGTSNVMQYSLPLTAIDTGDDLDNRLTNKIGLRRIVVRTTWSIVPTSLSTSYPIFPYVTMFLVRDKIAATPGVAPPLYAVDANPPQSVDAIYSLLGQSASTPSNYVVAPRNPVTSDRYHIYHIHRMNTAEWQSGQNTVPTAANVNAWISLPTRHIYTFEKDLHGVRVTYPTNASPGPLLNGLWLLFFIDYGGTTAVSRNGFEIGGVVSADLEFFDIQDDA